MDRKFSGNIEKCLLRLDRGEGLLDILADYPDCQEKLKPLLLVAMASRSFPVPVPNHTAQRLGKNQMLEEMEQLRLQGAFRKNSHVPPSARLLGNLVNIYRSRVVSRLALSYRLAVLTLVLVMSGGFLTLNVSASSQPGDILYSLKLRLERVQQALSNNSESQLSSSDQVVKEDIQEKRTTDRSILVLNDITYQLIQDGRAGGAAAVAEAEAQANLPLPSFTSAQTQSSQGADEADMEEVGEVEEVEEVGEVEEVEEVEVKEPPGDQEENNQGKALGKAKENQGKAIGKNKPPKVEKAPK